MNLSSVPSGTGMERREKPPGLSTKEPEPAVKMTESKKGDRDRAETAVLWLARMAGFRKECVIMPHD